MVVHQGVAALSIALRHAHDILVQQARQSQLLFEPDRHLLFGHPFAHALAPRLALLQRALPAQRHDGERSHQAGSKSELGHLLS